MVNYLRQLDRLIEYKEKMNIPDKDIENFLYRAQEKKMYRLVLNAAIDDDTINRDTILFHRLMLLTKHYPTKILDVEFSRLRSIEGVKVDFGHLQYKFTVDDFKQMGDIVEWWRANRLKENTSILDKVAKFAAVHKYTNHMDWQTIEKENYGTMLHANPLLFLFSRRAWFTYNSNISPRTDAPRLATTVKELLDIITHHEVSNARIDTGEYHITLDYEDMYCIVKTEQSHSLKGEHYYALSFVDSRTHVIIDTLGLRSNIGTYQNGERDVARLILFVMSNINPNAWDDYHLDEQVDHWFTEEEEKKDELSELEAFFKRHDANRDRLVHPEHGRYRYMVCTKVESGINSTAEVKPAVEIPTGTVPTPTPTPVIETPVVTPTPNPSTITPVYVDRTPITTTVTTQLSTPAVEQPSNTTASTPTNSSTKPNTSWADLSGDTLPLTNAPATSTPAPVITNPVNVSAKALKETEQLWAGDDGNGITLTDAQFKEFLNFLVDKAETGDIESDNPLIVGFHSLLNCRR